MKKISKDKFAQLWQNISKDYELYLPVQNDSETIFSLWNEDERVNLEAVRTNVSPKTFIFPQSETYMKFRSEGKKLQLENVGGKKEDYVLFGVRPCDVAAFKLIDNVFLMKEPVDQFYKERRERGTIVSLACSNPEDSCFCGSFGIDASAPAADVAAWDIGDAILWEPQSEKGNSLTAKLSSVMTDATEKEVDALRRLQERIKENSKGLPLAKLDPKKIKGDLKEIFDAKVWDEFSPSCLACGACTYVCPTCHCYDIQDFAANKCGERFRCWDSCMFSDFTKMAHGNPRTSQKERFRQRFMHKLVYYPNNNAGAYACVGCGRCIEKCPVNMNIVKVIKRLGGER